MPNCSAPSPFDLYLGDASLDHLDANPASPNVLRWNDGPSEEITGSAILVGDGRSDRGEISLGNALAKVGLIGGRDGGA